MDINEIQQQVNKKFGKYSIFKATEIKGLKLDRLSTGSFSLDVELGGGLPRGRIIELFGQEGAGKSMIASKVVANAQKNNEIVAWIDAEGVFSVDWMTSLGVNVETLLLSRPDFGEQACDILDFLVRSHSVSVVVLDSIAALIPALDLETDMQNPEKLGDKAQMMNRVVRKLHSALNSMKEDTTNQTIVVLINQVRESIGSYGDPEDSPGGRGIKFGASVRLNVRRGELIEEGEGSAKEKVGHVVKFKTVKNKTFAPYRTGQFTFYFKGEKTGQIDNISSIIDYGILYGVIKQAGSFFSIGEEKFQGREKLKEHLRDKTEVVEQIRKDVMELVKK